MKKSNKFQDADVFTSAYNKMNPGVLERASYVFVGERISNSDLRAILPGFPKKFRFVLGLGCVRANALLGDRRIIPVRRGMRPGFTVVPTLCYGYAASMYDDACPVYPVDEHMRLVCVEDIHEWYRGLMRSMYLGAYHNMARKVTMAPPLVYVVACGLAAKEVKKEIAQKYKAIGKPLSEVSSFELWHVKEQLRNEILPGCFETQALLIVQKFIDWYDTWEADGSPVLEV